MEKDRARPMSRTDVNIKPIGFKIPGVDMEKLQEHLQLPEQFCNTCTLREGTIVIIILLQCITALFVAFILMLLIWFPDLTEEFWHRKFAFDLDYYINNENVELIDQLYPLWRPFAYALIVVESLYFLTGWMVVYALAKKTVHPGWYLPWLIMTGLMVSAEFGTAGTMIIVIFILMGYRDITVTWDVVPVCLVITYGCLWFYGFTVVIAHYRRRCIVKYWNDHQRSMGGGY